MVLFYCNYLLTHFMEGEMMECIKNKKATSVHIIRKKVAFLRCTKLFLSVLKIK